MPEKRWKRTEREIAACLGGQRVPINGRKGADVAHPLLAIEVKSRATLPGWLRQAIGQAIAVASEGQLPVAVLHEVGTRHGADLVLLRLCDFKRVLATIGVGHE